MAVGTKVSHTLKNMSRCPWSNRRSSVATASLQARQAVASCHMPGRSSVIAAHCLWGLQCWVSGWPCSAAGL
jgi:hypothetical protein